jgi:hypothetical protein
MDALSFHATEDTPKIEFDYVNGLFEISGRSLPEDSITFYTPVGDGLKNYIQSPKEESNFTFHFEYLSTSSTKQVMKLFMMINELDKIKTVNVFWKYDLHDEDTRQTGQRLQKLTAIEFKYLEV